MEKDWELVEFADPNAVPLAESNVSIKLSMIQRRCSQLLDDPDALSELTLEEPLEKNSDDSDPYNRG